MSLSIRNVAFALARARRSSLLTVGIASVLFVHGGGASAQSTTRIALPTPAAAQTIVSRLWSERESAFAQLYPPMIGSVESASAQQQDEHYIRSVLCGCEPRKDPHPADRVVAQIPKTSVQPVFFAQVHTTNARTHTSEWYVVAVERDNRGAWKLAFINFGDYKAAPPLHWLTRSNGYTAPVTAESHARMTHLADVSVHYAMTHNPLTERTNYGATIHTRFRVTPDKDGNYGLALPSGEVLSCFTLHSIDTYSLRSGLQQGPTRSQWGHLLAPGVYTSITTDAATPMCVAGKGVGNKVGVLRLNYERRILVTTGVRKQS
jgi:hypothetical protein